MSGTEEAAGPQVRVEQIALRPGRVRGSWLMVWNVENTGQGPIEIVAGHLPHSQFRAEEHKLRPRPILLPGESAGLEFAVACEENPGVTIENAFLIMRVTWSKEPWRILARMRVELDEQSKPRAITELVTRQRVGFSIGRSPSKAHF